MLLSNMAKEDKSRSCVYRMEHRYLNADVGSRRGGGWKLIELLSVTVRAAFRTPNSFKYFTLFLLLLL